MDAPPAFAHVEVIVGEKVKRLVIPSGQHQDHDLAQKAIVALHDGFVVAIEERKASVE